MERGVQTISGPARGSTSSRHRRGGPPEGGGAGRVTFTDDGSTVYLHLFPREGWPHKHPGQAFVLAWADYEDICGLAGFRELVRLGRLAIRDSGEQIARWLGGREGLG